MGYQLITAPIAEPLSLAEVKAHLRVDIADDDALITLLIVAARQYCEQATARSLVTQQWALVMDGFYATGSQVISLERGPVQSIDSIAYLDMGGVQQVMPATDYAADLTGMLARITPRFGKIWPITLPQIGTAAINFTAGFGAPVAVPEGLKSWMKLRIGSLYRNREAVLVDGRIDVVPLPFIDSLLDAYRIVRA